MVPVTALLRRLKVPLVVFALLLGSVGHHHRGEMLSHGTFLFPPDHPAHAPFVPEPERPCVACAIAALSVPGAAPYFLIPPLVHPAPEIRAERLESATGTPALSGRSPPLSPA